MQSNTELIYLDNSYSMQQTDSQGEPLLYHANSLISNYLKVKKPLIETRFLNNDKSFIISASSKQNQVFSEVEFSKSNLGLKGLVDKADFYGVDKVHVYSDFQKSTFQLGAELDDSTRQFVFHKLKTEQVNNSYVDTVYLVKSSAIGKENMVVIDVKSIGESISTNVLVRLQKDNRQLAALTLDLSPNQLTSIEFPIGVNDDIAGNYEVSLQEGAVVFDNRFYFTISQPSKPNVAIMYDESIGNSKQYFQKVYSNSQLFNLSISSIRNASFASVTNADLLVLVGLEDIPDWLLSQIDLIRGRIVLVPPSVVNLKSYSQLLNIPITYQNDSRRESLSEKSIDHPLMEGVFNNKNDRMGLPEVKVTLKPKGFYESILLTNGRQPYLIKSGTNPFYLFAGPMNDSLTNFHKHSLFVPVMYKLAQPVDSNPLYYRMSNEVINLSIDSVSKESLMELRSSSGTYIPGYRYERGNQLIIDLPIELKDPGIYHLVVQGDTLKTLAFDYGMEESELAVYSADEIREFISGRKNISFEEIDTDVRTAGINDQDGEGLSLWKYALLLALFFLTTESLLLRFLK